MKIILSGGTGYIGSAVLTTCLSHPSITTVLILTRRPLPDLASHPKAKPVIIKDFTSYDASLIEELRSADAAIWCLGTYNGDEKVDVEFPLAFIKVVKSTPRSTPFRYVQLGGAFTEPPPPQGQDARALWYFANGRRVRGLAEARVMESAEDASPGGGGGGFEVYAVKPGGVVTWPRGADVLRYLLGTSLSVKMEELTATMVDLAVNGKEQRVLLNRDIIEHARKLGDGSKVDAQTT